MNMPLPIIFTSIELVRLDPQMRAIEPVAALASIVDLGDHLVGAYDTMTPDEQDIAIALSEAWPTPPYEPPDLPLEILVHMPPGWGNPPEGKELIRRRAALCRERLQYLQEWRRFKKPGVLEAELQQLIDSGAIEEEDRQNAIAHLERGETLANLVSFRNAMREMEKMLNTDRQRVNTM